MPYAVLTVGVILIAISIYLAAKQPEPAPQLSRAELEELVIQIQLAADDAIGRIDEKLAQVDALSNESKEEPQLPALAQQVQQLAKEGFSHEEIASKLGRGKGEIELALGIAGLVEREKAHE